MRKLLSLLCLTQVLFACGSWVGNPPKDQTASTGTSTPTALVDLSLTTSGLSTIDIVTVSGQKLGQVTFTVNQHVFKDFSFYNDQKPATPQFPGTYLVDMLSGKVEPSPKIGQIPVGHYTKAALTPVNAEKGQFAGLADDDPLIGKASHVKGTFTYMGQTLAFDNLLPAPGQEISIQGLLPEGASNEVLAVDGQTLVLGFHLERWFVIDNPTVLVDPNAVQTLMLQGLQQTSSLQVQQKLMP